MALQIDKPNTQGRTEQENIENLQKWANKMVDQINYQFTHLDRSNFAESPVFDEQLQRELAQQYEELRALIVARTQREI